MDIIKITLYTCMKLSENKNYMKIYKTRHGFTQVLSIFENKKEGKLQFNEESLRLWRILSSLPGSYG